MNSEVNLWFARNSKGEIITIDKVDRSVKDEYSCPICGSEVIPKAIKDDAVMSSHFAHRDKKLCETESMIHWWSKNEMFKTGDIFYISNKDEKLEYKCKEIHIEQEYKTSFGVYNPDITVITEDNKRFFFEICYKSKKKISKYIDMWLELKDPVIEISVNGVDYHKSNIYEPLFINGEADAKKFRGEKTYIDTIGKFKKEAIDRDISINDLQKLDWFWNDVTKLHKDEIDIENIVNIFDSIEDLETKKFIFIVLKKAKCSDIIEQLLEWKKEYFKSNVIQLYNSISFNLNDDGSLSFREENIGIQPWLNWIFTESKTILKEVQVYLIKLANLLENQTNFISRNFSLLLKGNNLSIYGAKIKVKFKKTISVGASIKIDEIQGDLTVFFENIEKRYNLIEELVKISKKNDNKSEVISYTVKNHYLDLILNSDFHIELKSNEGEEDVYIKTEKDSINIVETKLNEASTRIMKKEEQVRVTKNILKNLTNNFKKNKDLLFYISFEKYLFQKNIKVLFTDRINQRVVDTIVINNIFLENILQKEEEYTTILKKMISDKIRTLIYKGEFDINEYSVSGGNLFYE